MLTPLRAYPGFVGGSYVVLGGAASPETTINFFVEQVQGPTATVQSVLQPTPGVVALASGGTTSSGRGLWAQDGRCVLVIGDTVYTLSETFVLTARGTVAVDAYPATICANGDGGGQVFITSGNNGYIYDVDSGVFTQVRTGGTRFGAHIDGYFLALDADTSTLYLSDLLDGLTWDPTQFAQRSIQPDPWVSLVVRGRHIWLLGEQTSEVWYDAGTFPFPFVPHPSGLVYYGCKAPFSPKVTGGALFWLAQTAEGSTSVVRAEGFSPEVVSSFPLSATLSAATTVVDAIGDAYDDEGHGFYLLTCPTANLTACYDHTLTQQLAPSQRWTQRGTWRSDLNRFDAWRPLFHAYAFGRHLTLDRSGSVVYEQRSTATTDVDDLPIRRVRVAPSLWAQDARQFVSEFQLHVEAGLGAANGQGADPQAMLRVSPDGGKTFGVQRLRSTGVRGDYQARTRWLLCGQGRRWTPEITFTDPVPCRILGASYRPREAA
jgi:hypothetical protein